MFKKVLFIILIIICTVCTVGVFRYNPTVNTTNKIPVSADAVIRVNLREIEYSMLKDVVKHPFSYLKLFKKNQHKKAFYLIDEVVFPSNIFLYSNNKVLKNTWVSTAIEIKNKQDLLSFFNQEGFIKKSFSNVDYFRYKNLIYCVFNNELKLMFGLDEIRNIETKLTAILNTNNYLKDENSIVQKLKNSKKLIAMSIKNESFLELGIDENTISITGDLAEENMPFLSCENQYKNNNKSNYLATVSGRIKKSFLFDYLKKSSKNRFEKLTNLSLDSIQTHWNGEFNADLTSFIHQKDTIISYEYDDDFNKIAKTTIQKTILPDLNIRLGGSALFEYLSSKKAIKNINEENVLVVNPFFKTYVSNRKSELLLFSKELRKMNFDAENNYNNKFSLFFDVEKSLKTQENSFLISNNYLAEIKNIQGIITKNNKVNFKIYFEKTPQNFIFQVLK